MFPVFSKITGAEFPKGKLTACNCQGAGLIGPLSVVTLGVIFCLATLWIGYAATEISAETNWYEEGLSALHAGDYDKAIKNFTLTLEIFPQDYEALSNRGVAWFFAKHYDRAIEDATRALKINPHYSIGANQLAWMLATCPDPQYRDGKKAVALAEKVVERFPEANFMDTLAAAYAEAGNMTAAAKMKRLAVERLGGEQASSAIPSGSFAPPANETSPEENKVGPTTGQRFTVHLLSFRQEARALEKAASLARGKDPVFVHRTLINGDETPWFRIYIGDFLTRQAAQDHADRLKKMDHRWAKVFSLPDALSPVSP